MLLHQSTFPLRTLNTVDRFAPTEHLTAAPSNKTTNDEGTSVRVFQGEPYATTAVAVHVLSVMRTKTACPQVASTQVPRRSATALRVTKPVAGPASVAILDVTVGVQVIRVRVRVSVAIGLGSRLTIGLA